MDLKKSMIDRIEKRKSKLIFYIDKLIRQIEKGKMGGEEGRLWLEKYAIGEGVNLGCGDFPIGESLGLDGDQRVLGMDLWGWVDRYTGNLGPLDYVVTNYLDCFPDVLTILRHWHSMLKTGGKIAIVVPNSDVYTNNSGPFSNRHRLHCFSPSTLRFYLEKIGFKIEVIELVKNELRVVGVKI